MSYKNLQIVSKTQNMMRRLKKFGSSLQTWAPITGLKSAFFVKKISLMPYLVTSTDALYYVCTAYAAVTR